MGLTASQMIQILPVSHNSVNKILKSIRKRIALICESSFTSSGTIIECDESYFGARRVRGIRGRGAKGKIIVFGIFDRGNRQVYTRIVDNLKSETLISIIKEKHLWIQSSILTTSEAICLLSNMDSNIIKRSIMA